MSVVHNGIEKDSSGNQKAGFNITGILNRFDFGLKWNKLLESGGLVVGEKVEILIDIFLVRQ